MSDAKQSGMRHLASAAMNVGGEAAPRAFIACPISDLIDVRTRRLVPEYERFVRGMRRVVTEVFENCFLALDRESWGESLMEAHSCAPLDFEEMKAADLVVAYPGNSCGVSVELGWASAYGKPIVLLLERSRRYSPLIEGLPSLAGADVHVIYLTSHSDDVEYDLPEAELRAALRAQLSTLRSRSEVRANNADVGPVRDTDLGRAESAE